MRELPKIVSADDHVVEPANVWTDRLPAKYRETGPRVVRQPVGPMVMVGGRTTWTIGTGEPADCWVFEDKVLPFNRLSACAGYERADVKPVGTTYDEMRTGCYDVKARLEDMDVNWVEASLCFPTVTRFAGQLFLDAKDHDLGLLGIKAYNDWMVDEWCGESAGRLIPLCLIPLWDPRAAAAEVRRNADRGVRAVCFSEQPAYLDLPSIHDSDGYWEPFFDACNETSTVICMHEGSGSRMPRGPQDAPAAVANTYKHIITEQALVDWLFSGVLSRYPNLKITFSEGQVGWIPYILARADRVWEYHVGWNEAGDIPEPPSTYYWNRVYGCFFDDEVGLNQLDAVGRDQITFEVDYPHADGTWPHSRQVIEKMLTGVDDETVYKIVRGNTIKMLGLDLV